MVLKKIGSAIKEACWRTWYGYISRADKGNELTFMNYGYSNDTPIPLDGKDEKNRYQIQLYDKVVRAIPTPLEGVDMLEVGCGRGGGAHYVSEHLQPRSLRGIDICQPAVDFCKKHKNPRLAFSHGDALDLPFEDETFGAVINIESSHRYPDMPRFLSEVKRVLRLDGYFSFVDFRDTRIIGQLEKQMRDSGMEILEREDITSGIVRSLELDDERKLDLIRRILPRILHIPAKEFASVKGSRAHRTLKDKERTYMRYLLQR